MSTERIQVELWSPDYKIQHYHRPLAWSAVPRKGERIQWYNNVTKEQESGIVEHVTWMEGTQYTSFTSCKVKLGIQKL